MNISKDSTSPGFCLLSCQRLFGLLRRPVRDWLVMLGIGQRAPIFHFGELHNFVADVDDCDLTGEQPFPANRGPQHTWAKSIAASPTL